MERVDTNVGPLPIAPGAVRDEAGGLRLGAYQGYVPGVSWKGATSAWRRQVQQKTWQYVSVATAECIAALAIIDLGWAAGAFCYFADLKRRQLLVDRSFTGLPGLSARVSSRPGDGASAKWRSRGAQMTVSRAIGSGMYGVEVDVPGLVVRAQLDAKAGPAPLCAIAAPTGGLGNCTHKTMCLPVRGFAEVGGRRYVLDGATGAMDHTCGLLPRETRWRWASAVRPDFGLNLVEGFNGPVENAVWLDGQIWPISAARFELERSSPQKPWRITSEKGELDLHFEPVGARGEDRDLVVAMTRYVQPFGFFSGKVRVGGREITIAELPGVTEDHEARW